MASAAAVAKAALVVELRAQIAADLAAVERSQRDTQSAATHEEARPENDKDTRALEQSYLARGLAERVGALREELGKLSGFAPRTFGGDDAIALGARLVLESEDGRESRLFVAPVGGGRRLSHDTAVVTPASPLGRAVLGKRVGDEVNAVAARAGGVRTVVGLD